MKKLFFAAACLLLAACAKKNLIKANPPPATEEGRFYIEKIQTQSDPRQDKLFVEPFHEPWPGLLFDSPDS